MAGRERATWARVALLSGAALVVFSPMLRASPTDGLPLSNYPMFAPDRGRDARIPLVVGLTDGGRVVRLDPDQVAATDEVMLAAKTVSRALREGPAAVTLLCADVASRMTGTVVSTVQVRTETYDVVAWYDEHERRPSRVEVHATCAVDR